MQEFSQPTVSILAGEAQWRSRKVRYYQGNWGAIQTVLPTFEMVPFSAGPDEPANPFLQTVMRRPLSAAERPIPIGTVSQTYKLVQHREVVAQCRKGLLDAGVEPENLNYEIGLSELDEWMHLCVYLPEAYDFADAQGAKLRLRIEGFNSVNGSSSLLILFGWFSFVCSNGMVIGETKIRIEERHRQGLDVTAISKRVGPALKAVELDRRRMKKWQEAVVTSHDIAAWVDEKVTATWGKKAAARTFHICVSGTDVQIENPFAPGHATEKPVLYLDRVPGSPARATTKYDVSQAMSYVASHRANAEERVAWLEDIPRLLAALPAQ